jgi:hypothetical protein
MPIKVSWLAAHEPLTGTVSGPLSGSLPNLPVSGCNTEKLPFTVTG